MKCWKNTTIGEQLTLQRGHDLPEKKRTPGIIPVIGSFGITGKHNTAKCAGAGVTIGRSGASIGVTTYCGTDFWPLNTALYVKDFKGNNPRYIYYYLHQQDFRGLSTGSAQPSLNRNHVHQLPMKIPPLSEQKAIASILGSLDDKIELNNQMNQTLETMARTLYKSWFVDFDPVVAKAAGKRPYGMDEETAALFPDKFVDSELGPIPEGWRVIQLEEIADVNWGDTNVTKKSYVSEGYTAYSAKGPDGKLPYYDYSVDGIVLSAIGANCGLTWFAQDKWSCIKNTIRIIPKTEQINIEFIYYATDDPDAWPIRGSAQPFISQGDVRQRKIIVPTDEIAKTFGNSVRNWHKLIYMNSKESQTLAQIRDLLLPKLISGEIRIKDAEKVVEEVL